MKITLNWLKRYVDFDWSSEELAEQLTMLGLEVEGVEKTGGEYEGIVVAQVITREKHPNADKLSLCRVNDGKGERQIVCGAHNFQAGDKVPLILPGFSLPAKPGEQPFTIKVGKIRGVESHGMMCSPQELGLPDQIDGLLLLRPDAKVGQPFAEYLGRAAGDVVYDLEITPNRPDWNSVIGIAREVSALTGNPVRLPSVSISESGSVEKPARSLSASELVNVRLDAPELCPRYTARVIRGVKIGPSPDWLRSTLEKVGLRSINNVVDVTNYVMLETGQPLHAFDYHLLHGGPSADASDLQATSLPTIVVRRAAAGEEFTTLDGQKRKLTAEMLLIADETKPVALAGVMGGQNTEINHATTDVLLESAYFKPTNIRATSKKLDLKTESSYRFERGSDIGICEWASRRAAQLIVETAGGELAAGVVDAYPQPVQPKQITLCPRRANALLGLELSSEEMTVFLTQLGIELASGRKPRPVGAENDPTEALTFMAPTFRVDLKREVDLIEEIARLYGVDKIPPTPPRGALGANAYDRLHDEIAEARRLLTGLGFCEAQGQTLISETAAGRSTNAESLVPLANPLSSDMNVLRPSLLPGMLDALRHNVSHKNPDVALFEIGRVFLRSGNASPSAVNSLTEERRVAVAMTGRRNAPFWTGAEREAKLDLFDLKGRLEEFLEKFGLRGITYQRCAESTSLLLESATVHLGRFVLGEIGQLQLTVAKVYDLRDPVWLGELNLDVLLARRNVSPAFKPLPLHPSIRRDIAMLVSAATTHEAVLQAVKQAKPANLESVELFDIFRGEHVPMGQKSIAYAFTYRAAERTLTDTEVNAVHEKVVNELKHRLQAVIR